MKTRYCLVLLVAFAGLGSERGAGAAPAAQQTIASRYLLPGDSRKFAVEYVARVKEIPAGTKRFRLWVPVPQDSTVQEIRRLEFSRPPRLGTEPKYGDRIACWELTNPRGALEMQMSFECIRREARVDLARLGTDGADPGGVPLVYLQADRLVVVDETIRALSQKVTAGRSNTVDKARAIYDYVLGAMTYDKSQPGWGQGSTRFACEAGRGNCSDFHALFNSLCRAQGIASGFEIGLYLPYERSKQETLGSYHCWAFFRVPGRTWVPVDCSEADRHGERRDYFFGAHTSNRVTLSTGRDLVLVPAQQGPPLNFFVDPYAEADGKPVAAEKTWSYRDLDRGP